MNKVVILLSTYNGGRYLKEQLDSLYAQGFSNLEILARDDGSDDSTLEILDAYEIKHLTATKNLGTKGSFVALLEFAVSNCDADYFMFCDQDDVWDSDKVEKTIIKIQSMEKEFGNIPLLVHTDLEVVDEKLNTLTSSMWDYEYTVPQTNSFNRLLIQNTITGCTVMINKKLAKCCLRIPNEAIMHDWWIGLVASRFGKIGYINESTIKYRQHGNNVIGAKGFRVNVPRYPLGLVKGLIFRDKNYLINIQINIDQAKAFLEIFEDEIDANTKTMLQEFTTLGKKSFWQKRAVLWKYKLLKQGFVRNAVLFIKL